MTQEELFQKKKELRELQELVESVEKTSDELKSRKALLEQIKTLDFVTGLKLCIAYRTDLVLDINELYWKRIQAILEEYQELKIKGLEIRLGAL